MSIWEILELDRVHNFTGRANLRYNNSVPINPQRGVVIQTIPKVHVIRSLLLPSTLQPIHGQKTSTSSRRKNSFKMQIHAGIGIYGN